MLTSFVFYWSSAPLFYNIPPGLICILSKVQCATGVKQAESFLISDLGIRGLFNIKHGDLSKSALIGASGCQIAVGLLMRRVSSHEKTYKHIYIQCYFSIFSAHATRDTLAISAYVVFI